MKVNTITKSVMVVALTSFAQIGLAATDQSNRTQTDADPLQGRSLTTLLSATQSEEPQTLDLSEAGVGINAVTAMDAEANLFAENITAPKLSFEEYETEITDLLVGSDTFLTAVVESEPVQSELDSAKAIGSAAFEIAAGGTSAKWAISTTNFTMVTDPATQGTAWDVKAENIPTMPYDSMDSYNNNVKGLAVVEIPAEIEYDKVIGTVGGYFQAREVSSVETLYSGGPVTRFNIGQSWENTSTLICESQPTIAINKTPITINPMDVNGQQTPPYALILSDPSYGKLEVAGIESKAFPIIYRIEDLSYSGYNSYGNWSRDSTRFGGPTRNLDSFKRYATAGTTNTFWGSLSQYCDGGWTPCSEKSPPPDMTLSTRYSWGTQTVGFRIYRSPVFPIQWWRVTDRDDPYYESSQYAMRKINMSAYRTGELDGSFLSLPQPKIERIRVATYEDKIEKYGERFGKRVMSAYVYVVKWPPGKVLPISGAGGAYNIAEMNRDATVTGCTVSTLELPDAQINKLRVEHNFFNDVVTAP